MNTITADGAMLAVLGQLNELAEIRDSDGIVIGFFAPVSMEHAHLYAQAAASISPAEIKQRKEIDWPELERRANREAGKGCRLHEIFERMKALTTDSAVQADLQRHIDRLRAEDGCDTL